jgi:hypothetical protein
MKNGSGVFHRALAGFNGWCYQKHALFLKECSMTFGEIAILTSVVGGICVFGWILYVRTRARGGG